MSGFTIGYYTLEYFLLGVALMMVVSILSSKASSWIGVPSLLLFLGIGMIAGSEGPGGIEFSNYSLAFVIGSICLIFILFDGGIGTSWKQVKPIVGIGISYSTLGVLFTCLSVGAFCHYYLKLTWAEGFLLGAIVSSTDAAAVFSILRSKNLALRGSLKQVLEFEAGSNDPMAIFLTMGILHLVINPTSNPLDFIFSFVLQTGLGVLLGYAGGRCTVWLFNNLKIDYDGLYAVFLISLVILIFSATTILKGSGFMAVYVAGLVIGNSNILRKKSLINFLDGVAWLAQISLFLVLGLLVFPSHLLDVWKEGIVLALFMMFIARPVSILFAAPKTPFGVKERVFVSWVGLRGAAPIILAILPLTSNYPKAEYMFNLVFFVVLFSVFIQGPTVPWLANKLGITEEMELEKSQSETFLPKGYITMDLFVTDSGEALGKKTVNLSLPSGVLLINLERENRFSVPKGNTCFQLNDKIIALGMPENLDELKNIFGKASLNS